MKKMFLMSVVFAGMLSLASAPAHAGACFDWFCDQSTGTCTFDASCSTASPSIYKYNFDFGDGTTTGLTGTATWSHTFTSGYDSNVSLTIIFFSGSGSATVTCPIWHHILPVGPQPPFAGRCQ
jgi:hypothetical protein